MTTPGQGLIAVDSASAGDLALLFLHAAAGAAITLAGPGGRVPGVERYVETGSITSVVRDAEGRIIAGRVGSGQPLRFRVALAKGGQVRSFRLGASRADGAGGSP